MNPYAVIAIFVALTLLNGALTVATLRSEARQNERRRRRQLVELARYGPNPPSAFPLLHPEDLELLTAALMAYWRALPDVPETERTALHCHDLTQALEAELAELAARQKARQGQGE